MPPRRRAGRGVCQCPGCADSCRARAACAIGALIFPVRRIDRSVEGFHARVVQHEVDHLDGILYPQRIRDLQDFGFEDVLLNRLTPMPD